MIAAAAGAGAPLSAMDGMLVAVKDELDCLPYPTTGKTTNFFFQGNKTMNSVREIKQTRALPSNFLGKQHGRIEFTTSTRSNNNKVKKRTLKIQYGLRTVSVRTRATVIL